MGRQTAKRRKKQQLRLVFSRTRILVCLVLLAVLAGAYYFILPWLPSQANQIQPLDNGTLTWCSVDVGQGDCTIVRFPDDKVLMVDAGSENHDHASSTILEHLEAWQITTIDWFVITHPDEDHFGGAKKLLANDELTFVELYCTGYEKNLASYHAIVDDYSFSVPSDGYRISGTSYTITFVSPFVSDLVSIGDSNDSSLMMTIEYENKIFVLTGDASSEMDDTFIGHANSMEIFNDVEQKQIILKVAHHGSKTGSSNKFLNYIFNVTYQTNNFALISCGKDNSYHHPHSEAVNRLKQYVPENQILVTQGGGDITLYATATSLTVNNQEFTVTVEPLTYNTIFITLAVVIVVACFGNFNTKKTRR